MQLFHLPPEIIRLILSNLENKNNLKNLCQVSKAGYDCVAPILYHSVILKHGDFQPNGSITAFLDRPERSQVLHYITELCVTCDFESDNETTDHTTDTAPNISDLLRLLKNGQLRIFSWHLGTCIPRDIFRSSGYLSQYQKNIKSISLITHGGAKCIKDKSPVHFGGFKALQSLSWIGIRYPGEMSELQTSLTDLCGQLIDLHLDAIDWPPPLLKEPRLDIILPSQQLARLENLSLGAFSLESPRLVQSLNIRHLRSLKLRDCPLYDVFLRSLYEHNQSVNLKCFEFQLSGSSVDLELSIINEFLQSFTGLEELYLSWPGQIYCLPLWSAVLHHSSSLRGMIYQTRLEEDADDFSLTGMEEDIDDNSLGSCLSVSELEWLGLCCMPHYLVSIYPNLSAIFSALTLNGSDPLFNHFVQKMLEVLHIRQSGRDIRRRGSLWFHTREPTQNRSETFLELMNRDFRDFVYWAFGPSGIQSLQLLAFGDFSSRGRFSSHNLILCRKDPVVNGELPCRPLDPDLERARGGLLSSAICNFLEACPTDPLFFPYRPKGERHHEYDWFDRNWDRALHDWEDESGE